MADRVIKPDSGNDLVLQNDDGDDVVEIKENDTRLYEKNSFMQRPFHQALVLGY